MGRILLRHRLFGTPYGITNGTFDLVSENHAVIDRCIKQHHYSHKVTVNRFLSFSVRRRGGSELVGALQLGYGIRPIMKHIISDRIQPGNYCEFDRMWLDDVLPRNSESQVIGLLLSFLRQLRRDKKFVITYADESVGNHGTIYKATNALFIDKNKVNFYQLVSGERIHPVSMWHRHGTRSWQFLTKKYPGIKHVTTGWQRRFLYILDKKERKYFQPTGVDDAVAKGRVG